MQLKNFIDGVFVPPFSGNWIDNINPATGQVYATLPDSDVRDVHLAVEAAQKAFPAWSKMALDERARLLTRIADGIEAQLEMLAEAEARDSGKAITTARNVDIPRAQANFRFFAQALTQFASESHHSAGEAINYTLRQPIGIVGCISPWNLPLYLFTWKIAPALAAGNCVIAKPSELTPMTAFLLSQICTDAGLPAGVLNIVHGLGDSAGQAIVSHPDIKAISFTGGTSTGQRIATIAAPMFKKLSLELGGKNPNIIFADCDFDRALDTTVRASFANNGQICLCGSRIYVERPMYARFRDALVQRAAQLKIGDPLRADTELGALVSETHLHKVEHYLQVAREEGGTILCGGERLPPADNQARGYFLSPAVIEGLPNNCRTNQEEIFGPVVTIAPFDTDAEAVQLANDSNYGLAAIVWTQQLSRAHRIAEQLQAGIVWVNCWMLRDLRTPFGGVKQSGLGREGGFEALRFFTEAKNVCIKYG